MSTAPPHGCLTPAQQQELPQLATVPTTYGVLRLAVKRNPRLGGLFLHNQDSDVTGRFLGGLPEHLQGKPDEPLRRHPRLRLHVRRGCQVGAPLACGGGADDASEGPDLTAVHVARVDVDVLAEGPCPPVGIVDRPVAEIPIEEAGEQPPGRREVCLKGNGWGSTGRAML